MPSVDRPVSPLPLIFGVCKYGHVNFAMMIEAIAAFSAVVGFGLAFFIERKLSRRTQKKSQRVLTFFAMTSFGVGLTGILIKVIASSMLDYPLRFSHMGQNLIFHMLLFPAILLGIAKLIGIKKGPSSANAGSPPQSTTALHVAPAGAPSLISVSAQDENHWALALEEFESDRRRSGLWAKAFAEANGDESAAKATYLRTRSREFSYAASKLRGSEGSHVSTPSVPLDETSAAGLPSKVQDLGQPSKAIHNLQKVGLPKALLPALFGFVIIAGVISVSVVGFDVFKQSSSTPTSQKSSDSPTYINGTCQTGDQSCKTCVPSGIETIPKLNKDQGFVILNHRRGDQQTSATYLNCQIVDNRNWSCVQPSETQYGEEAFKGRRKGVFYHGTLNSEHGAKMIDGNLIFIPLRQTDMHVNNGNLVYSPVTVNSGFPVSCFTKK